MWNSRHDAAPLCDDVILAANRRLINGARPRVTKQSVLNYSLTVIVPIVFMHGLLEGRLLAG